jgi:RNA polymerase sigma-70 factor (ECF subfamily)
MNEQIFATQSLVYGYMLKLTKNPNDAHDASMNGILKAIDNADKYDGSSKVSTWVCTIAYRLWLDTIRSHSNSKTTYTGDLVFLENVGGFYNHKFDVDDISGVWASAKEILNEKQFACIKLHSEGIKYKEIASRLSIPIGSVMSAISGAKKKLRDSASFKSSFEDLA